MNSENTLPLIKDDPWLSPYAQDILARKNRYLNQRQEIVKHYGSLSNFANAYQYYGVNFDQERNGWYYREWAPGASKLYLIGDFNHWDRTTHPMDINIHGDWEIFLPYNEYKDTFVHQSKIKVTIFSSLGRHDRIPAFIKRVVQDPNSNDFAGQLWFTPDYSWTYPSAPFDTSKQELFIYEAHVGMAQEKEGIGTYIEFTEELLPRIKNLGYNAIQLMAIMEHPYYGSFGYHVSNFFAPSSRFGTPEELKALINKAHELGIAVIMDIVHSHAVKNFAEGLNEFDGTSNQYFHEGSRGYHDAWDSKLFNYGKWDVQRFLLSNIKYWLDEFKFDGFRFDGVTSMLYFHHGYISFNHYDTYFKTGVDWDCETYLQMANELIKEVNPQAVSIAEDVSGMPGISRSLADGGMGFDYRLAMGLPDFWIKILKEKSDEEWDIHELWNVLINRRFKERTIAYAESHDQAMVGDKTIAFWLMDSSMYFHMMKDDNNIIIERGLALHKMIRLITIALGGDAYLNFMGNEFGHPEWIDFPRQGNNWSYKYARRQWSLADSPRLKYQFLLEFDNAMIHLMRDNKVLGTSIVNQVNMDQQNNVMIFERNQLLFVFNFDVKKSIFGYKFKVPQAGKYQLILNTDDKEFGGFGRIDLKTEYFTDELQYLSIYLTNRTALVFKILE
ncbi:MAG: 1,4-alpha-glucan-branching enzyme [Cytophagales bacterium]|nr:MAG: 1,4-alpha-glucan-branching enzyme [Cytophagales bacterium]